MRNWIFDRSRYGLPDMHQRDWDEPAGNGGFLFNGGRVYIDMGHLEYCTPECASTLDLVRYDRAGDLLLQEAVETLELEQSVSFIRNNIEYAIVAVIAVSLLPVVIEVVRSRKHRREADAEEVVPVEPVDVPD